MRKSNIFCSLLVVMFRWANAWFQTLRTAYGMFLFGLKTANDSLQAQATAILRTHLEVTKKEEEAEEGASRRSKKQEEEVEEVDEARSKKKKNVFVSIDERFNISFRRLGMILVQRQWCSGSPLIIEQ